VGSRGPLPLLLSYRTFDSVSDSLYLDLGLPKSVRPYLDLGRVRVSVDPGAEWVQTFKEAWRLQQDHFWVEDMSGVDWRRPTR
jgi:hypothetical protein